MSSENFITQSEQETIDLGKKFAVNLQKGDVVAFYGDLGAGKTEFIKGVCEYFSVDEIVTSPTFTIMNQYKGKIKGDEIIIIHIDLYRIKNTSELEEIGFEDCIFSNDDIKLIEWAAKARQRLTNVNYTIEINLSDDDENRRTIIIEKTDEGL